MYYDPHVSRMRLPKCAINFKHGTNLRQIFCCFDPFSRLHTLISSYTFYYTCVAGTVNRLETVGFDAGAQICHSKTCRKRCAYRQNIEPTYCISYTQLKFSQRMKCGFDLRFEDYWLVENSVSVPENGCTRRSPRHTSHY